MRRILFAAVFAAALPLATFAQVPTPPASVRPASAPDDFLLAGTITGVSDSPVPNADVVVMELGLPSRVFRTDSAGHFLVQHLTSRAVTIRIRAFGYAPKTVEIRIQADDGRAGIVIPLEAAPAKLAGVAVNEQGDDPDRRLAEFYTRKATNHFAHFVDGEEIDRRKPSFVSEALRAVPGVTLTAGGRLGNVLRLRGCAPLVWIDGVRMPGAQLDELVAPGDVAGIEVYNSFAGIPSRYFDRSATCGTILVWIKS